MCWVLYLAADRPLPVHRFDPASPGFNVANPEGREATVRAQFSKPFVYALGAHTWCGCGFDREQANPDHPEELQATESSLHALRTYLAGAVKIAGALEMFACWDGDQAVQPDLRLERKVADFGPGMSWFPDRTFVRVLEA